MSDVLSVVCRLQRFNFVRLSYDCDSTIDRMAVERPLNRSLIVIVSADFCASTPLPFSGAIRVVFRVVFWRLVCVACVQETTRAWRRCFDCSGKSDSSLCSRTSRPCWSWCCRGSDSGSTRIAIRRACRSESPRCWRWPRSRRRRRTSASPISRPWTSGMLHVWSSSSAPCSNTPSSTCPFARRTGGDPRFARRRRRLIGY